MNVIKSKSFQTSDLPKGKSQSQANKLNLYHDIPNVEVSLDDFEEYALDRLKVRRSVHVLHIARSNRFLLRCVPHTFYVYAGSENV